MRKIDRLRYYGVIFFAFLMQILLADFLKIGGAKPNFVIIAAVFFALFTNEKFGLEAGFVCGFIFDVFALRLFGLNTALFSLSGYLLGRFNNKVYRESIATHAIAVFFVSFFILTSYRFIIGVENRFFTSGAGAAFIFSPVVFLAAAYNSFFAAFAHTFLCRLLKLGEVTVI